MSKRESHRLQTFRRKLRIEPLEDRRLLAIIGDTFADSFAQTYRVTGEEVTVLTADAVGNTKIFYHANDELGYIDPATGDLLFGDFFLPETSSVFVLDATPNGNVSDLAGVTYSNGQPIIADGGLTVYHRDGSIMRSGGDWSYDAGATFFSAGDWFWSNGNQLLTGADAFHPNGVALRNGSSLFYAGGTTFQNGSTLNYATGQSLQDGSGDYFYEGGVELRTGNTLYHPTGGVMVEADGTVRNENGDLSFAPYTRTNTVGASEVRTDVSYVDSHTTIAIVDDVGGAFGAYVTRFDITYLDLPPDPVDLEVIFIDATTLYFSWASGGGTPTGYRVAWADGVSAPGDVSGGVDTTDNYYVVSGLAPGQKVSLRIAAKDGDGDLSYGVIGTGTAGALQQTTQTGQLIASALDATFAQVYDTVDKNIILTVDRDGNSHVWYRPNAELGYINIDNGDLLRGEYYRVPETEMQVFDVTDVAPVGNLAHIPDGARYQNAAPLRIGDVYYHDNGSVLRSASGTWFYSSGSTIKDATTTFWPANIAMRSGMTFRYPNNAIVKSGTTISYPGGLTFLNATTAIYGNGATMRNVSGNLFYETEQNLFASNMFSYQFGVTMIDSAGNPYFTNGSAASFPFEYIEPIGFSSVHIAEGVDRIARYAIGVVSFTSVHVLGGNVDYSVALPPKPADLTVESATTSSVTFDVISGGGTTQDFVYDYRLGTEAPYISDDAVPVVGNSFTIEGLTPGQLVAVRVWARNSEGELSPGITAVGTTSTNPATGDFDGDGDVDGRDFLFWQRGGSPMPFSGDDLALWQEEYGEGEEIYDLGFMIDDVKSAESEEIADLGFMISDWRAGNVSDRSEGETATDEQTVIDDSYTAAVDRALEELAAVPRYGVNSFGEMVARRSLKRGTPSR